MTSAFICPACNRSAFRAAAPIYDYTPRRWLVWLPPRKRWIGDFVICANAACQALSVAGLSGIVRLEAPKPPPESGERNGPPPEERKARPPDRLYDSDMRWFR